MSGGLTRFTGLMALLTAVVTGCASAPDFRTDDASVALPPRAADAAPTPKDILYGLMRSAQVPLTVDPSCHGVGTEADDLTIGAYLSGFLAELSDPDFRNAIETDIEDAVGPTGVPVWRATVLIGQAYGEVVWRWGVSFAIDRHHRSIIPESFRCIGAG